MKLFKRKQYRLFTEYTVLGVKFRKMNWGTFLAIHPLIKRDIISWYGNAFAYHHKVHGYEMDREEPRTLTEKILWLHKYYYSRWPDYRKIIDKKTFKDWMREHGYGQYLPEIYAAWTNPENIKKDWDKLPERFILKAVRGSKGMQVLIVYDKSKTNMQDVIKQVKKWRFFGKKCNEVFAEQLLMDNESGGLTDYKMHCTNGRTQYIVTYNRPSAKTHLVDKTFNVYTRDWAEPPFVWNHVEKAQRSEIQKPDNLDKLVSLAEDIAKNFPWVRVDMYSCNGKIYIGELTFLTVGARFHFDPIEWDFKLGDTLTLPEKLPPIKR